MYVCTCGRFFENQSNEICSHSIEKPSKGRFFNPDKLQNHTNEGKGKEKKKEPGGRQEEKRKKQWLHSWFLEWLLWRSFLAENKLLGGRGLFGDKVFKNLARSLYVY